MRFLQRVAVPGVWIGRVTGARVPDGSSFAAAGTGATRSSNALRQRVPVTGRQRRDSPRAGAGLQTTTCWALRDVRCNDGPASGHGRAWPPRSRPTALGCVRRLEAARQTPAGPRRAGQAPARRDGVIVRTCPANALRAGRRPRPASVTPVHRGWRRAARTDPCEAGRAACRCRFAGGACRGRASAGRGPWTMVLTPGRDCSHPTRQAPRRAQPPAPARPRARARARPAGLHPLLAARERGPAPAGEPAGPPCTSPPGPGSPSPRPAGGDTEGRERPALRLDRGLRAPPPAAGTVQPGRRRAGSSWSRPGPLRYDLGPPRATPAGDLTGFGARAGGRGRGRHFRGGPDLPDGRAGQLFEDAALVKRGRAPGPPALDRPPRRAAPALPGRRGRPRPQSLT